MSTRDLIDAIQSGDSLEIENAFNSIMSAKVSDKIDAMRSDIAQTMFASEETIIDDEEEFEQLEEVDESMDQSMSKILAKGYTSSQEHGDKAPRMSAKQKEAAKARRDAQDAADMKKYFAKHDAEMRKEEYDDEELTLEDYSLEELEEYMMSEEFEQLDELSKSTIGNYIKKSKSNIIMHGSTLGTDINKKVKDKSANTMQKRAKGINKAVDRLTK